MDRKLGVGLCPFWGPGVDNVAGPRPTSVRSFILVRPTV